MQDSSMALVRMFTVEEEFKKNEELKRSDLEMLKDWLKKQHHLPPMSDAELILFLHSNYYRMEPTKTSIDTFFTVRTHVPELFSSRDPLGSKEIRNIMKVACYISLPGSTPEGYKVAYARLIDSDPSHYIFGDILKLFGMFLELWLYTSGTNPGHIILLDMEGLVFGHVARFNPIIMKKFFYYLQAGLPIRLKGLLFMNAVPFVDVVLNLIRPLITKELMNMLSVHSSLETLSKIVPVDLLLNDQGGKAGFRKDLWANEIRKLEEHRAWFQGEELRKANESVRSGKPVHATDIFGVEGSFKKLDID